MKPSNRIKQIFRHKFEKFKRPTDMQSPEDAEMDPLYQHLMNESIMEYLDEVHDGGHT